MTENDKREAIAALAIIQVALSMDDKQKIAMARVVEKMGNAFLDEGFGIGHMIAVTVRFATSIAAEQRWSKAQFLAIVREIYDAARPGADAVHMAARKKLG